MGYLDGKTALVTASSRNLGAAIVRALAAQGASVVINHHTTDPTALVESLSAEFAGHFVAFEADASDSDSVRVLVEQAVEALGPIHVLVNNAGPFSMDPFAEIAENEFRRIWDSNITAALAATQAAVPGMRDEGWGRIVNVSAGSAFLRNHSIYTLAKSAMITFTEALALELAPEITVNCVAPGQIAESAEDMAEFDPEFVEKAIASSPMGRLPTRPEVAGIVAELCSPRWDIVTGATVPIDGGWRLRSA